jgi:Mn2+/Fe2+ NRAMP family transporter
MDGARWPWAPPRYRLAQFSRLNIPGLLRALPIRWAKPSNLSGVRFQLQSSTSGNSNVIALAIVITTAATLHRAGVTNIETSTQAAEALKPIAGAFTFTVFAVGIIGTGCSQFRCWRHQQPMLWERAADGR